MVYCPPVAPEPQSIPTPPPPGPRPGLALNKLSPTTNRYTGHLQLANISEIT